MTLIPLLHHRRAVSGAFRRGLFVGCVLSGAALLTGAALAAPWQDAEHLVGSLDEPRPVPRPVCVGPLDMADADSGEVVGCGRFRLPDVDACEWFTPRGRRAQAEARRVYDGRNAIMRLNVERDGYGRRVVSPELTEGDLATDVVARGLAVRVEFIDGAWEKAGECEE